VTGAVENALRTRRDEGVKLLVPYITGGLGDDWTDVIRAAAAAGADAIEIGIPFSDPVMDGPVIQEASLKALQAGATPQSILSALRDVDVGVPLLVMTYYNLAFRAGHERFAGDLAAAGVSGCILPDLPFVESGPWRSAAASAEVEAVLLAAPTTPDHRLGELCEASRGFVYAVGLLGVTGERAELAASATVNAQRCKDVTDRPVLVGVGVSNPDQAAEAVSVADGVVVGTSIVRRMLEGDAPAGVGGLVSQYRAAIGG